MLVRHGERGAWFFAVMSLLPLSDLNRKPRLQSAVCYDDFIMKMSRFSRLFAASIVLFSLLFAQLSVAAYACPAWNNASPLIIDPDMPGCQGMPADQQSPTLCAAHCDNAPQSADTPSTPAAAPFIQATLCVVLNEGEQARAMSALSVGLPLNQAAAPPLIIRNCSFQI